MNKNLVPDTINASTEQSAPPRLSYKINEAAKILGVSPASVRRAIDRGLIKPCRVFRHTLISAEQLKNLVDRK